jgi:hypothetical protein
VPGEGRLFTTSLWLMSAGSYGLHVTVRGDRGEGMAVVPVQAVATRRLPMDSKLGGILAALGLFLFAGLVTLAGAAARESTTPPGQALDPRRVARSRLVMLGSVLLLTLGLWGGRAWWNGVDRSYAAGLYKPLHSVASVVDSAGAAWIRLTIDDPEWRGRHWTPLLADHGKLMHLFMARADDLGAIAHLHPVARDSTVFESRLPPLPAGRYRVYADIVHESGFQQTLTAVVELTAAATARHETPSDPDDSWFAGESTPTASPEPRIAPRGLDPDLAPRRGTGRGWKRDAARLRGDRTGGCARITRAVPRHDSARGRHPVGRSGVRAPPSHRHRVYGFHTGAHAAHAGGQSPWLAGPQTVARRRHDRALDDGVHARNDCRRPSRP